FGESQNLFAGGSYQRGDFNASVPFMQEEWVYLDASISDDAYGNDWHYIRYHGEVYSINLDWTFWSNDYFSIAANYQLNVVESDYSEVLPSFNLAYDLSDDLIVRASLSKVMSRAGYSSLNPAFSAIANIQQTATQGNSAIEPFTAKQGDIGVEWYFEEGSLLSATLFHKDIDSFVTTETEIRNLDVPGQPTLPYTTTIPVQGDSGEITGFETQLQKQFANGFGFLVNYTYADAEGKLDSGETTDLPGTSEVSYNLTGYFENQWFSVRLAFTHRDEFLAEGTALGTSLDSFEEQEFVDLSATWHVTENVDLTFEGINLTEEETIQNFGSGLNSLRVATTNGSRYFLKLAYRL
ncbi:MAG: TonB-dependent receptor, partial [Opitutales bacterium]|nr:TonB-dependent receptor [Opitutales bacterium]